MPRRPSTGRLLGVLVVASLALGLIAPAAFAVPAPPDPKDSRGTEFWLAFPGNYSTDATPSFFISGDAATTGTVEVPGVEWSQDFSIAPGDVTTVTLPKTVHVNESDGVQPLGIHVTAEEPVTVYGLNQISASTDAYLGYPVDALGTEHLILAYTPQMGGQATIAASADDTTVTITPSVTAGARPAGVAYEVELDAGDVYQLRSIVGDLTGTRVVSNRPVAVFAGDQCANIPTTASACDHIVEQLPPLTAWGTDFASMPLRSRTGGDTFRILAAEDDTEVHVDGELVATLASGAFHELVLKDPSRIVTSGPVLVAQYANGISFDSTIGDPMMMLVPPTEQFQSSYTLTTPATGFSEHHLNLVVPEIGVGTIEHNDTAIPEESYVAIGDGFYGVGLSISAGVQNLSSPHPFGVFVYGWNNADSYGYMGGSAFSAVATVRSLEVDLGGGDVTARIDELFCLPVSVRDSQGRGVPGIRVDYTVEGPNERIGFALTDDQGYAEYCYTGGDAGQDVVTAKVGQHTDGVTVTWTADPLPPGRPSPFTATATASKTIELSWAAPADNGSAITGYTLEWRRVGAETWTSVALDEPGHTLSGLSNGVEYEARVRATNALGAGLYSATIRAISVGAPDQVTDITAIPGDGSIALSWPAPGVVTGYELRWRELGDADWQTTIVTDTTASITGLANGTKYVVAITALSGEHRSPVSDLLTVTPVGPPAAIAKIKVTPRDSALTLSWSEPAGNGAKITGYRVRWRASGTETWTSVDVKQTGHTISGLVNGASYEIEVRARNAAGSGPFKAATGAPVAQAPAAPTDVKVKPDDEGLTVSWAPPGGSGGSPRGGYEVSWRTPDGKWQTQVVEGSPFTITGLTPGATYEINVVALNEAGPGPSVTVQATMPAAAPPKGNVERVRGSERTATAARLSRTVFEPGVPVVYIVHQDRYADAVAGGPAAAVQGGPILLVGSDGLPQATIEELQRLRPGRIVVLGGPAAVPAAVERALDSYTDGEVQRVAGTDRYATAAALSRRSFKPGVKVAYIATGAGFADSLSGGPAAADESAPILLTDPGALPRSVAAELRRLKPQRIVVIGGVAAVSKAVEKELAAYTSGRVLRVGGRDRFATSAMVAAEAFPSRLDTVYVATGSDFPDALAATPAAHAQGSAVLLVHRDAIPAPVAAQLRRLSPKRIVILGGEAAVTDAVRAKLEGFVVR